MGPELLLTVTSWDGFEGYPRLQPHYEILGLNKVGQDRARSRCYSLGLLSVFQSLKRAHVFEMKFKESVEMLAAPLR